MKRRYSPILLVGRETEAPGWLLAGLPAGAPVVCATEERGARAALRRPDVHVAIFDLHEDASGSAAILEDVPSQFPSVATIGMASRMRVNPEELLRVARAGVHAVLFEEDRRFPLLVRAALTAAVTRHRGDRVWGAIAPETPARVRPLVAYGLKNSHQHLSVDVAARALGLHRKTLAERCAVAGAPPPQQVLGWCRLLAAAILLEDGGRAVDHVAFELGFASGAAFRNMLKRYTGLNPGELRSRGTVKELARQFRTAMTPPAGQPAIVRAV
ncbi:MAG: helix-turn-helix transcriptional regulator [Gemmatimonadetes bacterium]|nr:helix-turn-helix transcriptional regulator [Gemmatimonadota bacterium]